MRTKTEDYDLLDQDITFEFPDCDFCDDRGCEECHPDDFAQMYLKYVCDGTENISDALDALEEFIKDLQDYRDRGFELTEPVDSGYFWLERLNQSSSSDDKSAFQAR